MQFDVVSKCRIIILLLTIRLAAGQGIYFATQASTSLSYTQPDADNLRHMFMGKNTFLKTH
jgi:hypothetical protein